METNDQTKPKQELVYYRPKFWKRIFLGIFDAVICAFLSFGFFNASKAIANNHTPLKNDIVELDNLRLESGIYIDNSEFGRITDVVTYYNANTTMSQAAIKISLQRDINTFHIFILEKTNEENYKDVLKKYDDYRLNNKFQYSNSPYYVKDESGKVIQNPDVQIPSKNYVDDVLKPYVDEVCQGLLIQKVPRVLELQKNLSNVLLFIEIPVSIGIAVIICYLIIPLTFLRGKQTIGRLCFRTGLVTKDVLMVPASTYILRFLIFFFLEVVVSVFTAGVPLFISISMMAFSKKKQTFHDYMLGIEEVDVENAKIFKNKQEISPSGMSNFDLSKFKMR